VGERASDWTARAQAAGKTLRGSESEHDEELKNERTANRIISVWRSDSSDVINITEHCLPPPSRCSGAEEVIVLVVMAWGRFSSHRRRNLRGKSSLSLRSVRGWTWHEIGSDPTPQLWSLRAK